MNLVAADVMSLISSAERGVRNGKSEPPHVGCYGSGEQIAAFRGPGNLSGPRSQRVAPKGWKKTRTASE